MIDVLRIEFQYHPVDIYELDLICFKDLQGSLTQQKILANFQTKREELVLQMGETFEFLQAASSDLSNWLQMVSGLDLLQTDSLHLADNIHLKTKTTSLSSTDTATEIIERIRGYLENLGSNMREYRGNALDCMLEFKADNEFQLNKIHKSITNRISDYILILKTIYSQVFDEFILLLRKEGGKISKKDQVALLHQLVLQQKSKSTSRTIAQHSQALPVDRASSGTSAVE